MTSIFFSAKEIQAGAVLLADLQAIDRKIEDANSARSAEGESRDSEAD